MKLTIGVMGSSGGELKAEVKKKVFRLGEAIADRDAILITGGCPGLPYEAVRGAPCPTLLLLLCPLLHMFHGGHGGQSENTSRTEKEKRDDGRTGLWPLVFGDY